VGKYLDTAWFGVSVLLITLRDGTVSNTDFIPRSQVQPLKTKRRPLYLKPQSVPRCKHFSSRL